MFRIHLQLDWNNVSNLFLAGSDVPLDFYTAKIRLRTSFGAHDVEFKVAFVAMSQHSFPLTGRIFLLMRDDLTSRQLLDIFGD